MERPNDQTIINFIQGEADEQQLAAVRAWIDADEQNAEELFETEALWQQLTAQAMSPLEIEKALQRVLAKANGGTTAVKRRLSVRRWLQVAAAIALLVVGGTLIYKIGVGSQPEMLTAQAIDSPKELHLADGTHVWLNKGARLHYPERFTGGQREVTLEGEGYFEVKKDSHHPFCIDSRQMMVKVLGTRFNMNTTAPGNLSEVNLIEGSVGIRVPGSDATTVLLPGQKAEVDGKGRLTVSETDTQLSAVWHDNLIPFNNANIRDIARTIETLYGVKVVLADGIDLDHTYSGCLQRKHHVEHLINLLQLSMPINYYFDGDKIVIEQE